MSRQLWRTSRRLLVTALLGVAAAAGLAQTPSAPEMSGLERSGRAGLPGAPSAEPAAALAEVKAEPKGVLANRVPVLTKTLAFYHARKPGEDFDEYCKKNAPNDRAGQDAVLSAHGILPERATPAQRQAAIERLGNVEYPLRDRAAVTELLDLMLVLAHSQEARGRDSSAFKKSYKDLRKRVADGLTALGGGAELLRDGLEEGELHSEQDLEPVENLVKGFRPALEALLAAAAEAVGAAQDGAAWADLGTRVEEARGIRERREQLRELAVQAAKASAFATLLAERGDPAGAARHRQRAVRLERDLAERLGDPRFARSHAADAADLLAHLKRRSLADPLVGGGAGRDLAAKLAHGSADLVSKGPPAPSSREREAARREIERLLLLASKGPYLLLIDYDGLRPDFVDKMLANRGGLGQESIPNLDRYVVRRGAFLRNTVTCFPSSTYPGTTTFLTGRHSQFHGIQSNTLFFKDVKDAQDRGSLSAARKINWVDYLSTKEAHYCAEHVPPDIPYLFEMLKPASLTFFPTSRGVKPRFSKEGFLMGMTGMFFEHDGNYVPFGDRGFDDLTVTAAYEMVNDGEPYKKGTGEVFVPSKLMTHYFAWIDHASHAAVRGQSSPEVQRFFEYEDRLLGRLMRMVEKLGILEETVIAVTSDHGHLAGPAETGDPAAPAKDGNVPFSLSKRFQEEGFKLRRKSETFQAYDAVVITDGEGTARAYLPDSGTDRWTRRHTFDELKNYVRKRDGMPCNLLELLFFTKEKGRGLKVNPAVDVGIFVGREVPEAGLREYIVYTARPLPGTKAGRAFGEEAPPRGAFSVLRRLAAEGRVRYRYLYKKGFDPLGYELTVGAVRDAAAPVAGGWHQTEYIDERDWLAMTMETPYPDGPFGIDNFFSGKDRSDFILSARPGYCFDESGFDRSDHGYLLGPSMRNTLLIAGRGIRRGIVSWKPHRSVDMLPTVLTALGATDVLARTKLDGVVADEILEEGFGR